MLDLAGRRPKNRLLQVSPRFFHRKETFGEFEIAWCVGTTRRGTPYVLDFALWTWAYVVGEFGVS